MPGQCLAVSTFKVCIVAWQGNRFSGTNIAPFPKIIKLLRKFIQLCNSAQAEVKKNNKNILLLCLIWDDSQNAHVCRIILQGNFHRNFHLLEHKVK